jgi:cellobiose phosphorylase
MKEKCSFGHFRNDGKEFVVTEPETPRALVNYGWNQRLISCFSQHGGGEGAYKERAMQYLDPRGRAILIKNGRRYFYVRDAATGRVWSPGWHPAQRKVGGFRCVHGPGYSELGSTCQGVQVRQRVFVPQDHPCEIWTVTLENRRQRNATLSYFSYVEWALEGYPRYCDYFGMLHAEYYPDLFAAQACNRAVERLHDVYDGFLASDREPAAFDTSRDAFLGSFGHYQLPGGVAAGKLTNSLGACEYLAGALQHDVLLAPGEEVTFNLFIGASSGQEMTRSIVEDLRRPNAIADRFARLNEAKQAGIDKIRIKTPDARVNALINIWIKQQMQVYADVGSDNGRGFRDAMQMLWATASYEPEYTRRMIVECLSHQFADGHTLRGWLPIDDHHYCDGPVWISPVIDAYLKETGDTAFLDQAVPYYGDGQGTVWEHVCRGVYNLSDDVGEHGLTRCHFGDWNDSLTGIGPEGRGESVWAAIAAVFSLKVAADIARRVRHNDAEADDFLARANRLTEAVNTHGWDGQWYLRAINDFGEKIGTHTEAEGRIYLLPQVWAIMAGIVDPARREQLFKVVDEMLETDTGSRVQFPPYTQPNPRIGRITCMVPGIWENGTAYCHANSFKVMADCHGGRGDKAYASFRKAMPDSAWNPSTHSGCEPYVMTNQFLGPENPRAGKTLWAWMTGSASWYYRAMTEWMIGVRADHDGLLIDPCLPSEWRRCELEREFRGARYRVLILNPHGLEKGIPAIAVDGRKIVGNRLPVFGDNQIHQVRVTLLPKG